MLNLQKVSIGSLVLLIVTMLSPHAWAQQDPPKIGRVQQPLVGGEATTQDVNRELGLVKITTKNAFCSGVALNSYWVLTAAHCVSDLASVPTVVAPPQLKVYPAWKKEAFVVQDVRELFSESGIDAALIRTRIAMRTPNDAGLAEVTRRPNDSVRWVESYGAGIFQLARKKDGVDEAAVADFEFRRAIFDVNGSDTKSISLSIPSGVTIAGGDSGGPSYIRLWIDPNNTAGGFRREIVGVSSNCTTRRLDGHEDTPGWTWVSEVSSCRLASVGPLRDRIFEITADQMPAAEEQMSFGGTTSPGGMDTRRALYNLSLDKPLVPPANGPMGEPLRFVTCVQAPFVANFFQPTTDCPIENAYEVWAFESARGWLRHLPSGRCVLASGMDQVRLGPCDAANPAHAWDVETRAPSIDVWTALRSRGTGTCLAAAVPEGAERVYIRPAAELVLQPCNGSMRQGWSTVDADWSRRVGPH